MAGIAEWWDGLSSLNRGGSTAREADGAIRVAQEFGAAPKEVAPGPAAAKPDQYERGAPKTGR